MLLFLPTTQILPHLTLGFGRRSWWGANPLPGRKSCQRCKARRTGIPLRSGRVGKQSNRAAPTKNVREQSATTQPGDAEGKGHTHQTAVLMKRELHVVCRERLSLESMRWKFTQFKTNFVFLGISSKKKCSSQHNSLWCPHQWEALQTSLLFHSGLFFLSHHKQKRAHFHLKETFCSTKWSSHWIKNPFKR